MNSLRLLRRVLWVAVFVAAAAGLTVYAARHAAAPGKEPQAMPAPAAYVHDYGPAPALQVQGIAPDDLKNHKILLTFFASWCAPCRLEHPVLMKLAKEMPPGAALWGVAMMDSDSGLAQFLKRDGNPFAKLGTDPSGTAGINWGVDGIPATFIVGADGHLLYRHFGPVDEDEVEKVILPVLKN